MAGSICTTPGAGDPNPHRAQIARGQELFNNPNPASGRACRSCHTAANNGQNVAGDLFDVGTGTRARRRPDMAVYTLRNTTTGELRDTTDWGRGGITGSWTDLNRFKVPNLRGLAARAPYFHDGTAASLAEVIDSYQAYLGFVFSADERADLLAFLDAL